MEYFYKKRNPDFDITQRITIPDKNLLAEYKSYNTLNQDEKSTALELTNSEVEMIDDIARERNISYSRALGLTIHAALSLYKEVTKITNSRTK